MKCGLETLYKPSQENWDCHVTFDKNNCGIESRSSSFVARVSHCLGRLERCDESAALCSVSVCALRPLSSSESAVSNLNPCVLIAA